MKDYKVGCVVKVNCGADIVDVIGVVTATYREGLVDVLFLDQITNTYILKSFYYTNMELLDNKSIDIIDNIDVTKYLVMKKTNADIFYFLTNMNDVTADVLEARKFSKQTLFELDIPMVDNEKDMSESIYGGLYISSNLIGVRMDVLKHLGQSETIIFRNGDSDTLRPHLESKYNIVDFKIKR